jgi:broad specificity phosphatase PhoE
VFLIRHANAGSRSRWKGDDSLRPLSTRGQRQAKAVARLLDDRGVTRVTSSPATRCVQTVAVLAADLGLEVDKDKRLSEGADLSGALDIVLGTGDGQAFCAHGDLIPEIMAYLVGEGMRAQAPLRCQKGSVWEIDLRDGRPYKARYHAPEGRTD